LGFFFFAPLLENGTPPTCICGFHSDQLPWPPERFFAEHFQPASWCRGGSPFRELVQSSPNSWREAPWHKRAAGTQLGPERREWFPWARTRSEGSLAPLPEGNGICGGLTCAENSRRIPGIRSWTTGPLGERCGPTNYMNTAHSIAVCSGDSLAAAVQGAANPTVLIERNCSRELQRLQKPRSGAICFELLASLRTARRQVNEAALTPAVARFSPELVQEVHLDRTLRALLARARAGRRTAQLFPSHSQRFGPVGGEKEIHPPGTARGLRVPGWRENNACAANQPASRWWWKGALAWVGRTQWWDTLGSATHGCGFKRRRTPRARMFQAAFLSPRECRVFSIPRPLLQHPRAAALGFGDRASKIAITPRGIGCAGATPRRWGGDGAGCCPRGLGAGFGGQQGSVFPAVGNQLCAGLQAPQVLSW